MLVCVETDVDASLRAFYDVEVQDRAGRPLGADRMHRVQEFVEVARRRGCRSVLEVGCGAGRDGQVLARAGLRYLGVDLSGGAVALCGQVGLRAVQASAVQLPIPAATFDAAWSMSTLMHLPGDGLARAVSELHRVVRPGGLVEIGVWGHTHDRDWISPDGRYFRHRSDESLRVALAALGTVLELDTWDWFDDGGHYQWVRVEVGESG